MTKQTIFSLITLILLLVMGVMVSPALAQDDDSAACEPGKLAFSEGVLNRALVSGDVARSYRLYIPPGYDPTEPTPLVFSFHGFTSNTSQQIAITHWNDVAEENGFVVVYPQGAGTPPRWNAGVPLFGFEGADDIGFVRDLLAQLGRDLCVDESRVYANGFSNGGGMSEYLACEMSDTFAAIGTVAGAYVVEQCEPERAIPVIFFHGTADDVVPYDGANGGPFNLPDINMHVAGWAERNGCDPQAETVYTDDVTEAVQYGDCVDDAAVLFYTVFGGGHAWPGDGFLSDGEPDSVDASEVMWEFYTGHTLP